MDIVNFDALKAQDRIIDPSQIDPEEDYFIIGKYTNHYTTNSMKYTKYPVYAIKAGDVMGKQPAYKVYSALLTQTGTDAPTWVELENTLGVPVDWYRDSSANGTYYAEAYGAFTLGKTVIVPGTLNYDGYLNSSATLVDQVFIITTLSTGLPTDSLLNKTFVEIRVYN